MSLGSFLARGNAGLQTPSPLLSGDAGDLLLQVLQYSHLLDSESRADSVPPQASGERQELLQSWGQAREPHLPKAMRGRTTEPLLGGGKIRVLE